MTIQQLRERLGALKKEARNLVENKGSATWTKEEQAQFDNMVDEAERIERQIEAHQRLLDNEAEDSFRQLPTKEKGDKASPAMAAYENYLRKMSNRLTPQEIEAIRNTMSTSTGSEGGYTVQPIVASTLIEALKDGTIDVIVSSHDPQDVDTKRLPFADAESGAIGLETLLPIYEGMYSAA